MPHDLVNSLKDWLAELPLPPLPTVHPPGSREKLAVMEQRATDGYAIFHPLDARFEGDTRTAKALKNLAKVDRIKPPQKKSKFFG